ncbi:MAG: conjugal transfer protein TraE, partial [Lachnospiraceae bacterium]|nr:conjugal transfer protein TraE [Lachnospiraceae bacterium]
MSVKKKQGKKAAVKPSPTGKKTGGLTMQEKKRMAELRHILSGNGKKKEVPTTAQKTITFQRMYKNGVCQVTPTYYTKMVEFFDINYDLLNDEEKAEVLQLYSECINFFEPGVKFQLFLFNRRVNERILMEQIEIPMQHDAFDDIREEFSEMLKHQMAKGNNGIVKSKYLLFGVEAKGFKEASAKLGAIENGVIKNLRNLGTPVKPMDGKERLRVLHEYFNQDSMEPFHFSYKDMAESGGSVKDYIAPPGFDFRNPNRFKVGNMYGSVAYLNMIAPRFTDELMKKLLAVDENISITMHLQTVDPVKAMKNLKGSLSNIQKMKIDEQKKAVRNGYDMDIMPPDISAYERDTLALLEDLNNSNQKMINATFLITCFGKTKRELESVIQRVSGIIQQGNCNLR